MTLDKIREGTLDVIENNFVAEMKVWNEK